jgi:hypothetical protein
VLGPVFQFFCIAANDGFDDQPRTLSYQITLFGPIGADVWQAAYADDNTTPSRREIFQPLIATQYSAKVAHAIKLRVAIARQNVK